MDAKTTAATQNYYRVLNLAPTASADEIRKAISRELRLWSNRTNAPDIARRQEAERMVRILGEAEAVLLDDAKRKAYDRDLSSLPSETREVGDTELDNQSDLIAEAWRLLTNGEIPDALYVATKATEKDGNNPEAWAVLARAKFRWGETEDAIYEYKRAIKLKPNEASYYFDLGSVYESLDRAGDALQQYQRASQIDPKSTMYRAAVGVMLLKSGKTDQGTEILERCVEEQPDNASYQWFLALAYTNDAHRDWVYISPGDERGIPSGYYATKKEHVTRAQALIAKAERLKFNDPELSSHIKAVHADIDKMMVRRFHGSILTPIAGGILWAYLFYGIGLILAPLYFWVSRPPQYALNAKVLRGDGGPATALHWEEGTGFVENVAGNLFTAAIYGIFLPIMVIWNFVKFRTGENDLGEFSFGTPTAPDTAHDGAVANVDAGKPDSVVRNKVNADLQSLLATPEGKRVGIAIVAVVCVIGVLVWWNTRTATNNTTVSSVGTISLTNAVIAQSIQNNQPVGQTAYFMAPATPALFATFINGRANSDVVKISVWSGGSLITSCNDTTIISVNGNVWCSISAPLSAGNYAFQLAVNGQLMGTYPFTVTAPPVIAPPVIAPPAPPASSISITNGIVAQRIENSQPIGSTTNFETPPSSVALFVSYANATVGDNVQILLSNQSGRVSTCNNYSVSVQSGNVWCTINSVIGAGNYFFEVAVNGESKATYPFTVSVPALPLQSVPQEAPPVAASAQPSFDCSKAHKWAEIQVCSTPALAADDHRMGEAYRALIVASPSYERPNLRSAQRDWIRSRDQCETEGGLTCLYQVYAARLSALSAQASRASSEPAVVPTVPEAKSATPATATFFCVKSDNGSVHATFVVDYMSHSVRSPNFGAIGENLTARISDTTISWHAREVRNYGFGGFIDQDMSIDRATGQLTDNYGDGVTMFNCHVG